MRRSAHSALIARTLLVAALLLAPVSAFAIHRQTPFLVALSGFPSGDSSHPSARGEPGHIAFESISDLLHNGSTGRQIFLYNLDPRTQHGIPLVQITKYAGDSANPWVSSQASYVVFDSAADILQTGTSARQIYLWRRQTGSFVQLTQGLQDSVRPAIDFKGNTIAFQSLANLAGSGIPGWHIYVYDLTVNNQAPRCDLSGCKYPNPTPITQITNAPDGDSLNPVMSDDGRYVFFQSNASLVGPSNGYWQIYVYDRNLHTIEQLTNGIGDTINPSTNQLGDAIGFQSRADLLNNGSSGWEIFFLDRKRNLLKQITNSATGDSFSPSVGGGAQAISFVSTADLLNTGARGQHLFLYLPYLGRMVQVTSTPDTTTNNPVTAGNAFTFFDTDEDIMNRGMSGRQVYSLNSYQRVPPNSIAKRTMLLLPPQVLFPAGGSSIAVASRDWSGNAGMSGAGQIQFTGGEIDFRAEAPITISPKTVFFPPVPVPGAGWTICLTATGTGDGAIDCDGGRPGGTLSVTQDHATNDDDPGCGQFGACFEDGLCQASLPGPHIGVCNGPQQQFHTGAFTSGQAQLRIPVTVSISTDPGIDGVPCSANNDDGYLVKKAATILELTTGSATGAILDADDVPGETLSAQATGSNFSCDRLLNNNFSGVQLVGFLPLLDIPYTPTGLRDLILSFRLAAQEGKAWSPCPDDPQHINCKVITLCTNDVDCDDNNLCNGVERCDQHRCLPGTQLACDDGNPCNGTETCNPTLGCQVGAAPTCDDGTSCTTDSCDPARGCLHSSIPGCCSTDADCIDNDLCNGSEVCVTGTCQAGPTATCDDGDICNGIETCDPIFGCSPGTPPDRFTLDGSICQVQAIEAQLNATPDQFLGGHLRVNLLTRMLGKAKSRLLLVRNGPSVNDVTSRIVARKRTANLMAALLNVRHFGQRIASGIKHHTVYPSAGNPLVDMAAESVVRLNHLLVQAPQS